MSKFIFAPKSFYYYFIDSVECCKSLRALSIEKLYPFNSYFKSVLFDLWCSLTSKKFGVIPIFIFYCLGSKQFSDEENYLKLKVNLILIREYA